jgi:hypothetical protein
MRKKHINWVLIIAFLILNIGCQEQLKAIAPLISFVDYTYRTIKAGEDFPERKVIRSLNDEEMAIPSGRYQVGINMERNRQVGYPSPDGKLKIEWSVRNVQQWNTRHVFVDREGCTWYPTGFGIIAQNVLIRVNPDGTINWKKTYPVTMPGVWGIWPVLMTQDTVICFQMRAIGEEDETNNEKGLTYSLECFDLEGNTMWQSELFLSNMEAFAWRISDDRFIVPIGETGDEYNIYSLSDGELVDNFKIPNMEWTLTNLGPLETPDGGWIAYTFDKINNRHNITRFNPDYSIRWQVDTRDRFILGAPVLITDNIFVRGGAATQGNNAHLQAIDINSGKIIFQYDDARAYRILGKTPDGNAIITSRFYSNTANDNNVPQEANINIINPEGRIVNSNQITGWISYGGSSLIIYEDGKILFGHENGLSLADEDGLIWTLDKKYFGYPDSDYLYMWNLNPSSDGRIVVSFWAEGKENDGTQIFSLGPSI